MGVFLNLARRFAGRLGFAAVFQGRFARSCLIRPPDSSLLNDSPEPQPLNIYIQPEVWDP